MNVIGGSSAALPELQRFLPPVTRGQISPSRPKPRCGRICVKGWMALMSDSRGVIKRTRLIPSFGPCHRVFKLVVALLVLGNAAWAADREMQLPTEANARKAERQPLNGPIRPIVFAKVPQRPVHDPVIGSACTGCCEDFLHLYRTGNIRFSISPTHPPSLTVDKAPLFNLCCRLPREWQVSERLGPRKTATKPAEFGSKNRRMDILY